MPGRGFFCVFITMNKWLVCAGTIAALLCGCTPPDYTKVQDAGIFAAIDRFRFEFGEPEAGKTHTFNFTAPSGDRFCFRLEKKNLAAPPDVDNIRASMILTGVRETVFEVSLPLSQWTRSEWRSHENEHERSYFFYHRDACVRLKRGRSYRLTFAMHGHNSAHLQLIASGGGWK